LSAFQHFTQEIVVGCQRSQNRTKANDGYIQNAVSRRTDRRRWKSENSDFLSLREMDTFLQYHDAILYAATSYHQMLPPLRI
jgi:hypothetical protein